MPVGKRQKRVENRRTLATHEQREGIMKKFILGMILGSLITGGLSLAGNFYDSKGQPAAPRGSVQQFDYFRQRQQQLDIKHMREHMDRQELDRKLEKKPC
jgi:hypothetical protein